MSERIWQFLRTRQYSRHAPAPEQLETRCLLFGGALGDDLALSGATLSSVQGVSESGSSLVESLPLLCGGPVAEVGQSVTDALQVGPVAGGDLDLGGISCCCPACLAVADVDFAEATSVVNAAGPAGATVPLSSVPILNSLAGAAVSLYLNFVGRFDAFWGSYSNVTTPAFDQDGDATTFSSGELDAIQTIWAIVAEDYAPFNINVTTVAPPSLANGVAVSVAIGGNGSWTGGTYGGIAYTDSFTSFMPNLGFVFSSNLGNNPKSVGDTVSHEAGHTFGLLHQSQYDAGGNLIREYSTGPGDGRAPIMGNSAAATRGLWWNGTTSSSSTLQNDMAVIASVNNGFGYRPDDHGNSAGSATSLTLVGTQLSGTGIIETISDQDYFSFSTAAGQITLSVDVMAGIANLDARLELRDAVGNLIASAAPSDSLSASLTTTVAAGNYRLVVASQGGYGDVGQYAVSGSVQTSNHAPSGTDRAIAVSAGMAYTFTVNDFGFVDPLDVPPDQMLAVRITTLPVGGQLSIQGVPVVGGQLVPATSIASGWLQVVPAAGQSTASFQFQVQDDGGTAGGGSDLDPTPNTLTLNWNGLPAAAVVNRLLYYNNSYYDAFDPAIGVKDDQAVAIDKQAYLPTSAGATFQSISSYSKGLNGVMIDLLGTHGPLSSGDFEFRVGNDNGPEAWLSAPVPTVIAVRPGAGTGGADRVQIVWPDSVIRNSWLQIVVKANANTGLPVPDTFYFGHALGESGAGNMAGLILVNTTDYLGPLNNARSQAAGVSVNNPYDYNRDGAVNVTDALIARNNGTNLSNSLRLITLAEPSPQFAVGLWQVQPTNESTSLGSLVPANLSNLVHGRTHLESFLVDYVLGRRLTQSVTRSGLERATPVRQEVCHFASRLLPQGKIAPVSPAMQWIDAEAWPIVGAERRGN